jgi:hypothetical protein
MLYPVKTSLCTVRLITLDAISQFVFNNFSSKNTIGEYSSLFDFFNIFYQYFRYINNCARKKKNHSDPICESKVGFKQHQKSEYMGWIYLEN